MDRPYSSTTYKEIYKLVTNNFHEYYETGDERKYLGYETYHLLREVARRIAWSRQISCVSEYGEEIIEETVGSLMVRIKVLYGKGREFEVFGIKQYMTQILRGVVSSKQSQRYVVDGSGESAMLILENIDDYLDSIPEMPRTSTDYPEAVLMYESSVKELVESARILLSQNDETSQNYKLLTWPVIYAAIHDRPDIVSRFDKRTSTYLKYVVHTIRTLIYTKFGSYDKVLG